MPHIASCLSLEQLRRRRWWRGQGEEGEEEDGEDLGEDGEEDQEDGEEDLGEDGEGEVGGLAGLC